MALSKIDTAAIATDAIEAAQLKSDAIAAGDLPANSILQVVNTINTTQGISIDTSTFTDTGIQVQITPSATSSKVLLLVNVGDISYANDYGSSNNSWVNDEFFRRAQPYASRVPYMKTIKK